MPAKRSKHLARDTGVPFHLIAHDRDDRLIGFFIERCQMVLEFEPKFVTHSRNRQSGVGLADGETNRVLG